VVNVDCSRTGVVSVELRTTTVTRLTGAGLPAPQLTEGEVLSVPFQQPYAM
jgi:hypothetical protein